MVANSGGEPSIGPDLSVVDPDGDVVVVKNPDDTVTVFGAMKHLADAVPVNPQFAQALMAMLGRQMGDDKGAIGQRVFSLRPEDYAWFDQARKMSAGDGFVRGTLRDVDGKITRQVAIKEVKEVSAKAAQFDPMTVLVAGQLASIQQQLDRIEDRLETIGYDIRRGIELVERDQTAQIVSAITIVGEVYANFGRSGVVGATDWARVVNPENIILMRHVAVVAELEAIAGHLDLNGSVENDKKVIGKVCPKRWETLLTQETVLRQAGLQWVAIYADRKREEGHVDIRALDAVRERHSALADRANAAARHVFEMAQGAPETNPRPGWRQLLSNGLVVGGKTDDDAVRKVGEIRERLVAIGIAAPTVALDGPQAAALRLISPQVPPVSMAQSWSGDD
ncbi:MAG: hypothetical protein F2840_16370 [Actinobacteria bacterium]|uniref:Unannotated protein n=1 Tax=freshwater metagenome TaxID=449393 RepID=A0A6J7LPH6_9ZZZZ|nr:hypothetical protein [Actinomycetota bacterium]